jgi:peptide/nickel transport system ATP-binding protein
VNALDSRDQTGVGAGCVLTVDELRVDALEIGRDIVDGVDLRLGRGETIAIVGESGSGKTTAALALLGVARPGTRVAAGRVSIDDTDILSLPESRRRGLRGSRIAYVPQNPATALSPTVRIGRQLDEIVDTHLPGDPDRLGRVRRGFAMAQLPDDDAFRRRYPHALSGGQQQRVCIAMALVCEPDVVVMDEPTTGLDVTTQARLLDEIRGLADRLSMAIVYVSHDLAVVRNIADRVIVLYGGRIVEDAPTDELFREPRHPYTRRLLEAIPRVDVGRALPRGIPGSAVEPWNRPTGCVFAARCELAIDECRSALPPLEARGRRRVRCLRVADALARRPSEGPAGEAWRAEPGSDVLLAVDALVARYGSVVAVDRISLEVRRGHCLGIVGESGSGKSTLLRCVAGLHERQEGVITLEGTPLATSSRGRSMAQRKAIALVPQNPDASLNPRQRVGEIVGRPLKQFLDLGRSARAARVHELLELVRLGPSFIDRMPRELSGGEKQRVAIARGLAADPQLLLCGEVTSALDVAVQAGVLTLLDELRRELGTTLLFVSHDLAVVRSLSDDLVVMRDGVVREAGPSEPLFENPQDQYTRDLLAAVPRLQPVDYPGGAGG